MRVCHLGKYYPPAPGGIETHLQTLARAQAALGLDVSVICVNHLNQAGTIRHDRDGDIRVTRVPRWASVSGLDVCPALLSVLDGLRGAAFDLVHLHTPNPTMLLPLALLRPQVPLVVTHHSDIVRQRLLRYLHDPFERLVYERAALILSTSARYIDGSNTLRRYAAKVEPLPLGQDLSPLLEPSQGALSFASELRKKHGATIWLSVGRLVYYKGLGVALEALKQVPGKLLVIGTGPSEPSLKEFARKLGVEDRVAWLGHASPEELVGAYHAAKALWFPSIARSEGFGLVQVEAMASSCPVINTAIPASGVSWVSLHEQTGLTVPVGDASALAAASRRLLDEPGLRQDLASQARLRAIAEFDHMTMGRRSIDHYRHALSRRRR